MPAGFIERFLKNVPSKGDIFELGPSHPAAPVKEPEDYQARLRMLEQMVAALVEENGRKDEEILGLRSEITRLKK